MASKGDLGPTAIGRVQPVDVRGSELLKSSSYLLHETPVEMAQSTTMDWWARNAHLEEWVKFAG